MTKHRLKSYIMLITVAAIWGAAGPIIKFTLGGIDPIPFLAYRFTISAIFSLIFFSVKLKEGKRFKRLKANLNLVILYSILAVPLALGILFIGLDKSSVLDLTLIGIIGPIIVTGGGAVIFHDHITRREKIGIGVVLTGVLINSFYPIFKSEGARLTGNILLLLYLLSDSSSVLVAKRTLQKKVKSSNLTNFAFIVGAIIFIPLLLITYGPSNSLNILMNLPLKYHLGVWYMALLSGSLAYFLYVRGQRTIEVSEAVLFSYLQPLFMIPLAVFWLGEKLSFHFIIGAAIIALGLFIAEYKKKSLKKQL